MWNGDMIAMNFEDFEVKTVTRNVGNRIGTT